MDWILRRLGLLADSNGGVLALSFALVFINGLWYVFGYLVEYGLGFVGVQVGFCEDFGSAKAGRK